MIGWPDIVQDIERKHEIAQDLEKWKTQSLETLEEYKREIRTEFGLPEDGSLDDETMKLVAEFEDEQELRRKEDAERQKDTERAQAQEPEEDDDMTERDQASNKPTVASAVRVVGKHEFVEDFDVEKDDVELEGIVT